MGQLECEAALHAVAGDSLLLRYEELMTGDTEFDRLEQFLRCSASDRRKPADFHARTTHPLFARQSGMP